MRSIGVRDGRVREVETSAGTIRTEVVVHKVNEAMEAKKLVLFTPDDFKV